MRQRIVINSCAEDSGQDHSRKRNAKTPGTKLFFITLNVRWNEIFKGLFDARAVRYTDIPV